MTDKNRNLLLTLLAAGSLYYFILYDKSWLEILRPLRPIPNLIDRIKNKFPLWNKTDPKSGDGKNCDGWKCWATEYEKFVVSQDTVSPLDGKSVVVTDLPKNLRLKNTGGLGRGGPGTGAGLCVFTSAEHSGRYQNEVRLNGLQKKMMNEIGGGYPSKLDKMITKYAPGIDYVQHTGGDEQFLELALKTGRMPAVTYAGRDGVFYNGPIAHMVNLVYLDQTQACILDNNYPDKYLWMSRSEFLSRWRAMSGGWSFVVLCPCPPPTLKD